MEASRARVIDSAAVLLLSTAAVAEAVTAKQYDERIEVPLAVLLALPLLVRRTHPVLALAGVLVVTVAQRLAFGEIWDAGSSLAIPMVAVFAVAAYADLLRAITGLVVAVVTMSIADIGPDGPDYAFLTLILGAIWLAGLAFHRQRSLVATVKAQAAALESAASEREQLAAAAERTRIARELHDVVAHAVSTIVVQAEAAQSLQHRDPERATAALEAIHRTGRQALDELRRMLGVLRDAPDAAERAPQPGLADIPQLVDAVRASGLTVSLDMNGSGSVNPGVGLTAYRVVQEALTNTLKHAGATHARVRVAHVDERLQIEIVDDGHGVQDNGSVGHGLVGMRERAQMHGGAVEVASTSSGTTVRVDLEAS